MYNKYNIGFPHKLKDCSLLYSCVYVWFVVPIKKSQIDRHSLFKEAVWRSG